MSKFRAPSTLTQPGLTIATHMSPTDDACKRGNAVPGKRVEIDDETWPILDLLARDRMMTFQELADEAFADLLKKHGRPVILKAALRQSAKQSGSSGAPGKHRGKK
jgi:hypothetical protein